MCEGILQIYTSRIYIDDYLSQLLTCQYLIEKKKTFCVKFDSKIDESFSSDNLNHKLKFISGGY